MPREIDGSTNVGRAYLEIKRNIIEGSLPPGSTFSEHYIAAQLEMSRTPVHQALDRLRRDEWVTIAPRSGVTVAGIEPQQMRDIYEALSALEGAAVHRLAADPDPGLQDLESAASACEQALEDNDLHAWAVADDAFHRLLLSKAGNRQLERLSTSVMEHAHRARLLTVRLRPRPEGSNRDHREILSHVAAGDPEGASAALHAHRQRGIETLIPILDSLFPTHTSFVTG